MQSYVVTAPDGQEFDLEGPDEAPLPGPKQLSAAYERNFGRPFQPAPTPQPAAEGPSFWERINTPFFPIPKPEAPADAGWLKKLGYGAARGAVNLVEGLETPLGVGTLALGPVGGVAGRLAPVVGKMLPTAGKVLAAVPKVTKPAARAAAGGFAVAAASGIKPAFEHLVESVRQNDPQGIGEFAVDLAGLTTIAGVAGKHALVGGKKVVPGAKSEEAAPAAKELSSTPTAGAVEAPVEVPKNILVARVVAFSRLVGRQPDEFEVDQLKDTSADVRGIINEARAQGEPVTGEQTVGRARQAEAVGRVPTGMRVPGAELRKPGGTELEGQPYELTKPEEPTAPPKPKTEPTPSPFAPERPLQGPERPEDYEIGQPKPTGEEPEQALAKAIGAIIDKKLGREPKATPSEPALPPAEVLPGQLPPEPRPAQPTAPAPVEAPRLPEHEPEISLSALPTEPKPARTPAASARPAPTTGTGGVEPFAEDILGPTERSDAAHAMASIVERANVMLREEGISKDKRAALGESFNNTWRNLSSKGYTPEAMDNAIKEVTIKTRSALRETGDPDLTLDNIREQLDRAARLASERFTSRKAKPQATSEALKEVQAAPPTGGTERGAPPTQVSPLPSEVPKAPRDLAELQRQLDETNKAIKLYEESDPDNRAVTPEENALAAKWYANKAYLDRRIARLSKPRESRPGDITREVPGLEHPMSVPAVEMLAKNEGLPEGKYKVLDVDENWDARVSRDKSGKITLIEFNARRIHSREQFMGSLRHEVSHSMIDHPKILDALETIREGERKEIRDFVEKNYADETLGIRGEEVDTRLAEFLAESYHGRAWYSKLLAQVQRLAYEHFGLRMSRGAAEAVAARILREKFGEYMETGEVATGMGGKPMESRTTRLMDFSQEQKSKLEVELMSRTPEERAKIFDLQGRAIQKWSALHEKSLRAKTGGELIPAEWSELDRLSDLKRKMGATLEDEISKYHEMLEKPLESRGGDVVKKLIEKGKAAAKTPEERTLPEFKIDYKAILPEPQETKASVETFAEPFGAERVPFLNRLWGGRKPDDPPYIRAINANLGGKGRGRAIAAKLGSMDFAGELDREFSVGEKGEWNNIRARAGASTHMEDVLRAVKAGSEDYTFTPEQKAAIDRAIAWNDRRRELLKKSKLATNREGEIVKEGEGDATWTFPRYVVERPGGEPAASSQFKERIYETEREGATPREEGGGGVKYEPSMEKRMVTATERMYNAIENQRLADNPALGGQAAEALEADIRSEPKYQALSEKRIKGIVESRIRSGRTEEPLVGELVYPNEIAKALNKAFPQSTSIWRKNFVDTNNAIKVMLLGYDVGVGQLQGLMTFFVNPNAWAKATAVSLGAFVNPKVQTNFLRRHSDSVRERAEYGTAVGRLPEYLAGARRGEPLERLPYIGPVTKAFARQFTTFLDAAGIYHWEAMKGLRPKSEWSELNQTIEALTGTARMESTGISPNRALTERALLLAPAYYRSALNFISLLGNSGVSGHVARQSISKFLAAGTLSYYGMGLGLGMSKEELDKRLDPSSRNFMLWKIKTEGGREIEVGFGGIYRSLVRLAGKAFYTAQNDPEGFIKFDTNRNPFMAWLRGHAGPGVELVWTGFSAKEFLGQKADLTSIGGKMLPIGASAVASYVGGKPEKPGQESATATEALGGLAGLSSFRPNRMSEPASRLAFQDRLLAQEGQEIARKASEADQPGVLLQKLLAEIPSDRRAKVSAYAIRHFRSIYRRTGKYEGLARPRPEEQEAAQAY